MDDFKDINYLLNLNNDKPKETEPKYSPFISVFIERRVKDFTK